MRALSWLKDLFSSERGNVLVVGAATLPLLLGSAAFAVDTIQLTVWKRQLQRAADSSSIAGAYALALDDDTHEAIHRDLDKNKFPLLDQEEGIWTGPRLGFNRTVRVRLTATRTLPFVSLFTNSPSTMIADATAALVDDGTFCMVSLYNQVGAGIVLGGNANVSLKCGMKTNAKGGNTITTGGNKSSIKADPVGSVGGIDEDSNSFDVGTTFQPYSAAQADPLGYLPNPSPDPSTCTEDLVVESNTETTLSAGNHCYKSITVHGNLVIPSNSTLTAYGGDVIINAKADIVGSGVTLVMTGAGGAAGSLSVNGGAKMNLSAPTSGLYKGVVMYRDRRATDTNKDAKFNGGSGVILEGAMYMPSTDITFNGNSEMNVTCLQMVGRVLSFGGTTDITNECPTGSGSGAFRQTVVRLVG